MKNLTKTEVKNNAVIDNKVDALKKQIASLNKDKTKAPKAKTNPNAPAQYSAKVSGQIAKIKEYDQDQTSVWKALLVTSAETSLDSMGLNKAVKVFTKLLANKKAITPEIKQALTFKNVSEFLKTDKKYGKLEFFSTHQIVFICLRLLKEQVTSVKISKKVVKQKATTKRVKATVKRLAAA